MKYILLILITSFLISCNNKDKLEEEIQKIPMDVEVIRFDKEFADATAEDLPILKKQFPFFFPAQYNDSIWVDKLTDTLQLQLEEEVLKTFPIDDKLGNNLRPLFQHIKYYFPKFKTPLVITTTSDVDYRNKVILADSMLVIALDTYLGNEHRFYEGIEKYVAKEMKPSQLLPDVAEVYSRRFVSPPRSPSFLEQIIYYGKQLYLKDIWLISTSDADKIGYTAQEFDWAEENELYMWRYFVENELLYSTDPKLGARFINPAPFSKFYLEIDNDSPGMLGRYLGWKIVRAYMQNTDASVQEMIVTGADEIFTKSKYKPRK
ncbi:MAG TPA: gliding motility lipoprotein GldB [Aequorivita sp.]|nr:gliding motility lipoprotein GldB [Aequorivita sp.]